MDGAKAAPNRSNLTGKTARGRKVCQRNAAHDRKISPSERQSHAAFTIHPSNGQPFTLSVKGRLRWTLERLITAGAVGCTPIDQPAPRWSGYVHHLRKLGVEIETLTEKHDGPYPGHHGRYVLRCWATQEGGDA